MNAESKTINRKYTPRLFIQINRVFDMYISVHSESFIRGYKTVQLCTMYFNILLKSIQLNMMQYFMMA